MRTKLMSATVLLLHAACSNPTAGSGVEGPSSSSTENTPQATDPSAASTSDGPGGTLRTTSSSTLGTESSSTASGSEASGSGTTSTTGRTSICQAGSFPEAWPEGTSCPEDTLTVHRYSEDTFILRQSLCTGFEGPFLYLMFGEDRVLLEDTGYNGAQVAPVVYGIIESWLAEHGRESIELVVANSHGHGDHVGGNGQFTGMPNTTVVGFDVPSISAFFGINNWPEDIVQYDLGGRVLDIIPIPGHQSAHLALSLIHI
ncbi:MAG: MBL fold metallo-hydrolase, partial [Nannocystaceae bacterium]|nr:MBL fold metallo-hydrolase [Nannocystaceae bacterium]